MKATMTGDLVMARKGSFTTEEGKAIDYWRIMLRDIEGEVEIGFHFELAERIFGNQKSLEQYMYKKVIVSGDIKTYQGILKFKGNDIQPVKVVE